MPTTPSPIAALPTPPSSTDPANFDPEGDAFLSALPPMATQMNSAATVTYNNAVEAAASAVSAAAARDAAVAGVGATIWNAATNYPTGTAAISPINYRTYIRKSPGGVNATDPSASALWEPLNVTSYNATTGLLEVWDGTQWVPQGWSELGTVATTSGTTVLFSSLPNWLREAELHFAGVSQSSTGYNRVRIGTSGGLVTTGYVSHTQYSNDASATVGINNTDGLHIFGNGATVVTTGVLRLVRYGNTWIMDGQFADSGGPGHSRTTGRVTLGAALAQIEVFATLGAHDAGGISLRGRP